MVARLPTAAKQKAAPPVRARLVLRCGVLRADGSWLIEPRFDEVGRYGCERVPVRVGAKWGFLDARGELVVEPRYDYVWEYVGGVASVEQGGRWSCVDLHGNAVEGWRGRPREERMRTCVGATATRASREPEGRGALWGFLDADGATVVEPRYRAVSDFVHGLAWVQLDGPVFPNEGLRRYAYLDRDGEVVVPPFEAFSAGVFSAAGVARVRSADGLTRFIDRSGTVVIEPGLPCVEPFRDGLAMASAPGRAGETWGFIDTRGTVVVPLVHLDAKPFSRGLAAVRTAAGWGFVDTRGRTVVEPRYRRVHPFDGPLTGAQTHERRWGLIDASGRWKLEPTLRTIAPYGHGVARFWREDGTCGLLDASGRVIADGYRGFEGHTWPIAVNRDGRPMKSGFGALGGRWGFVDTTGREVVPCTLDMVLVGFHEGHAGVALRQLTGGA